MKKVKTALKLKWKDYEYRGPIAYPGGFQVELRSDLIYARPSVVISVLREIRLKSAGYGDDTRAEAEAVLRTMFTEALEALNGSDSSSGDGK